MPRNPNSPHNHGCGPTHIHTSASENIKLQVMMSKLEDNLKNEFVLKEQLKTINSESLLGDGNIAIKSIDRIEKTSSENLIDTYTIYFNNDLEPFTFTITNGTQGEPGEKGDRGDSGQSAYELWVALGNIGSEEDFIAALKGADGKQGEKGEPGAQGPAGEQGPQGERGVDGADGKDGQNGVTPHIGENGNWFIGELDTLVKAQGADGKDGQDGTPGEKGEKGDAFTYEDFTEEQLAALKGEQGLAGKDGENGYTPIKGVDYFDGADGKDGKDGLTTAVKVNGTVYEHDNGVIELPNFITEHQSLAEYAKKAELFSKDYNELTNKPTIPSIEGLATEKYVDDAIEAIDIPETDLSDYYNKEEVDGLIPSLEGYAKTSDIPSLDDYATEKYVDEAISQIKIPDVSKFITEIPAEYITETELNNKGYLTEHQNLSDYAKKSEIPDVSNFITEIPSEYITETELNDKGYLTEHQSLTEYAKKSELFSKDYNELTNKPTIPSIEGLATESYVTEAIAAIDIPETDLSNYYNKEEVETLVEGIEHPKQTYYLDFTSVIHNQPATLTSEIKEAANQIIAGKPVAIYLRDDKITDSNLKDYGSGTVKVIPSDTWDQVVFTRVARSHTVVGGVTANWDYTYSLLRNKTTSSFFQYTATAGKQEFITKTYVSEAIANKSNVGHTHDNYALVDHTHDEYLTEHQSLENYYTKEEVDALLPAEEVALKAEVLEVKQTLSQNVAQVETKVVDEIEPTVGELKTWVENKEYLQDVDLTDYALKTEVAAKADKVLFTTAKFVTKPIGNFVEGEDINGLSLAELFAKLLGLSDTKPGEDPDTPTEPEGVVDEIITNKLPMYSVSPDGEVVEVSYDDIITYTEETASEQPTESGFYQITNEAGEIIESGYQELTADNPDVPYIIALPVGVDFNTMVTTQTYDTLEGTWKNDSLEMSNDYDEISALCAELGVDISHIDPTRYTLWADLEAGPTGKIHRFIITE